MHGGSNYRPRVIQKHQLQTTRTNVGTYGKIHTPITIRHVDIDQTQLGPLPSINGMYHTFIDWTTYCLYELITPLHQVSDGSRWNIANRSGAFSNGMKPQWCGSDES